jgi:hypothetical protein
MDWKLEVVVVPLYDCCEPSWLLPTRLVSTWTGLTHRPSWCHRGRAISVPFPARRLRFATVNHGH